MSVNSVSCGSLNHDDTGTALFGWNMYDAGELSRMMHSLSGRPSWLKSCEGFTTPVDPTERNTHFNVVAFVQITAFTEQAMSNHLMNVQLVQYGVRILQGKVRVQSP